LLKKRSAPPKIGELPGELVVEKWDRVYYRNRDGKLVATLVKQTGVLRCAKRLTDMRRKRGEEGWTWDLHIVEDASRRLAHTLQVELKDDGRVFEASMRDWHLYAFGHFPFDPGQKTLAAAHWRAAGGPIQGTLPSSDPVPAQGDLFAN
jgi:hypothetical protein